MPDFVDNTAGFSEVTGTADYLMTTTGTGLHLRLDQALTDGQQVAYYAIGTSNGVPAFESGVSNWDDSENTLVVDTITNSSNGGGKISWDAGTKTIYIVHNSATMVNTADPRLVSEDVDDLTPATYVDGTEKAAFSQGGDPVSITPLQILGTTIATASSIDGTETVTALDGSTVIRATTAQILGDPYRMYKSLALTRARGYSCMDRFGAETAITTTGSLAGNEPFAIYLSGAGTHAVYGASALIAPSISLSSGSTNAGYVTMVHTDYPYYFIAGASDLDARWNIIIPDLPTSGVQDFTIQIGFIKGFTGAAVQGMYLELTGANANWQKVVKNAAGTTTVSTGIAATTSTTTLRVKYNPTAAECQFWIDGVSSAAIDDSTRAVDLFTGLAMTASILKTTGTTARSMGIFHHLYDNAKGAVPHFT